MLLDIVPFKYFLLKTRAMILYFWSTKVHNINAKISESSIISTMEYIKVQLLEHGTSYL